MAINRRDFLSISKSVSFVSIAALSFGCSVKSLVKKNNKVALIYATRYGATKDTSQWIVQGMDGVDVDIINIDDISSIDMNVYDKFIFGSGIFIDGVDKKMMEFLSSHKEYLKDKIIASFIVCGTTKKDKRGEQRLEQYFAKFHNAMENPPSLNEYFGGRMIIDKLNRKDKLLLENFYKRVLRREFKDWDRTQPKKAKNFGGKIKI